MASKAVQELVPASRFLFWIKYDGSFFPEMARGGTGFGVMDLLKETVVDTLDGNLQSSPDLEVRSAFRFSPSSRTDAGVHALRSAVIAHIPSCYDNFCSTIQEKNESLNKFNHIMSTVNGGMEVLDFHSVSPGFCIRRHVSYRRYTYRIAVARDWNIWQTVKYDPSIECFSEKDYVWRLPPGFDANKAIQCCSLFHGEQVMGSFFKHTERAKRTDPNPPNALRNLLHVGVSAGEPMSISNGIYDYYNITVTAKSFLREQIRRMVSAIIFNAYGRLDLDKVKWLLKNPISSNFYDLHIPVAPPNGLFLTDVVYDHNMFVNPKPHFSHGWDIA